MDFQSSYKYGTQQDKKNTSLYPKHIIETVTDVSLYMISQIDKVLNVFRPKLSSFYHTHPPGHLKLQVIKALL